MTAIPDDVNAVFAGYPSLHQRQLFNIRSLIFKVANDVNVTVLETLKWGQPAYLTKEKAGSTVRLGWSAKSPARSSVFFICTSNLVTRFRELYPDDFHFVGDREIWFGADETPAPALEHCLAMALTYHRNKT